MGPVSAVAVLLGFTPGDLAREPFEELASSGLLPHDRGEGTAFATNDETVRVFHQLWATTKRAEYCHTTFGSTPQARRFGSVRGTRGGELASGVAENVIDAIGHARSCRPQQVRERRCIRAGEEILPFRRELVDVRRLADAATLRFVAHELRAVQCAQMRTYGVAADREALGQIDCR